MYTEGGRGGTVYHVTTLYDDTAQGSLRYAVEKSGARTIVFDVSGTIQLQKELKIKSGFITIAGQTAPGDGICIAGYPFVIAANNVIIRYLRFRLGNENVAEHEGDGLGGMDRENIIIDHCSVSWSIDECLSVYGSKNLTVQWCIADQSLVNSGHEKGAHGYGGNWGGAGASYHHNLMAHHVSRTPRLGPRPGTQENELMDLRNNVFYNWAGNGCYGGEGMKVNIVNNYYKPGPGTALASSKVRYRIASVNIRTTEYVNNYPNFKPMWHVWGKYYVDGNVNPSYPDKITAKDQWTYGMYEQIDSKGNDGTYTQKTKDTIRLSKPLDCYPVTTHTAEKAYEKVLAYAGASLHRDSHDTYVANDARTGTATYGYANNKGEIGNSKTGFVNSQQEAGGWPELKSQAAPKDSDDDGMPDDWEVAHGLNPKSNADGKTVCSDGYTNLEHYMNSLVEDITKAQYADSIEESYVRGDANNDGNVSVTDITTTANYILDSSFNNINKKAADSNSDGSITVTDITYDAQYILTGKFPGE